MSSSDEDDESDESVELHVESDNRDSQSTTVVWLLIAVQKAKVSLLDRIPYTVTDKTVCFIVTMMQK